jgi:hypothetical protein
MARSKVSKVTRTKSTKGPVMDDDGFEVIGGDNSPMAIGEVIVGEYGGVVRTLPAKRRGAPPVPVYQIGSRTVLGNAVLKARIEDGKVKEGDILKVTRLEDGTAKKGQSAPKLFAVGVKRAN